MSATLTLREAPRALYDIRDLGKMRPNDRLLRTEKSPWFELRAPRFTLAAGEFVGVVGDSGCGKSTLLDILALITRPSRARAFTLADDDRGEAVDVAALWEKGDEARLSALRRRRIGYVLQSGGLFPFLTVAQNIELEAMLQDHPPPAATLRAEMLSLIETLQIDKALLKRKPNALSGGQRQRVAIAKALLPRPSVILADEPTGAVHAELANEILKDFKALSQDRGAAVVVVSHDEPLLRAYADRIYSFTLGGAPDLFSYATCAEEI